MIKRILAGVVSTAMLTVSLTGCMSGKDAEDTSTSQQIKVSIGNWPSENQPSVVEKYNGFMERFSKQYPDIVIEPDKWGYDTNTFAVKAGSNQLPTLYNTYFTEADKIINAGFCADITEAAKKYGFADGQNPELLKLVTKDGKIYGVIENAYALGMFYNMKLLKAAGEVDENGLPKYPRTFEEMALMAQRIKQKTGKSGFVLPTMQNAGGWMFMNIAWSYGTEFMIKENGKWKATFNSKEAAAALQFVKDLKWKYNVLPDNAFIDSQEMYKLYATDQAAMIFTAPPVDQLIDTYKMNKDNIAAGRMPAGPKGNFTVMGGNVDMFSPGATPEQIDACFKWLEVRGLTPKVSEERKNAWETQYKTSHDKGFLVGVESLRVWNNAERVDAERSVRQKYTNVDLNLFKDYSNFEGVQLHPEEPVACQELYKTLDACIQAVITDQKIDPKELLEHAASDYQKNYLDRLQN